MRFESTSLKGVFLISLDPRPDERGHFVRTYCAAEFRQHGLNDQWPQCNETRTVSRGSVRGLHWQRTPHWEAKLVRCTQGVIWDVVVDVRTDSPTFGKWEAFELSSVDFHQLYIPAGFAHGFQTLTDNAVLQYQMSEFYHAGLAAGFRWNDPAVGITWPLAVADLSARDAGLPPLTEAAKTV